MLHVTARIKLLKAEEGRRTSCARSEYQPSIRFGDLYTDDEETDGFECLTLWRRGRLQTPQHTNAF